jgi:RHS repeat-associated protein
MKKLLTILTLLIGASIYSQYTQIETAPQVSNDRNWVSSISYDLSGQTLSKGVSYFNDLGKATQSQSWDGLTNRIWTSEVRYDSFGRAVLGTLSAPVNNTGLFSYQSDFILSGSNPVTLSQYENYNLFTPPTISSDPNTLGWYYSTSNTLDSYQDVTEYPYTRTVFSELNPGTVRAVLGGNKINGEWLQTYSFTMIAEQPDSADSFYSFYNGKKVMKTVSRDVHGVESVVYIDTDGNILGAARSGADLNGNYSNRSVYSNILDKGYVDIHISGSSGIVIDNYNSSKHNIRIFDLITEQDVTLTYSSYGPTIVSLPQGFYRIEDMNNYYGKNNTDSSPVTPLKIHHSISYYDLSYNEYDLGDRLIKTIQPVAVTQETTFKYNSLGQLLKTESVDEGVSNFLYRKDGQIRFSQNGEQAKINSFSYTNYDVLGRPIESGVYQGTDVYFSPTYDPITLANLPDVTMIVDELDGLLLTGRSEQNFSVYDIPDPDLASKLSKCNMSLFGYEQKFISGNVSYTYTKNPDTNKTWYSYDAYGRVQWIIQEPEGLSCLKTINYEYDASTGQLIMIDYQRYNTSERFIHYYEYNNVGQLVDVYTSLDTVNLIHQAHYLYNESGALVRTELADDLQGIDYVYNLSGQLKTINHPSLQAANDPGNDGVNGFAADVFGMQLDYYSGDYIRSNTPKPILTSTQGVNQYNGNIKATRWNTQIPATTQNSYLYEYNKNNWLTQATFGQSDASAVITPNADNDYKVNNITYDANGNILSLTRKGYTDLAGTNEMDNFSYFYDSSKKNRLLYVKDTEDNTDINRYNDLKDQEIILQTGINPLTGQAINTTFENYKYNSLGQLIIDYQEDISYSYNASGLVSKVSQFSDFDTGEYRLAEYMGYKQLNDAQWDIDKTRWHAINPSTGDYALSIRAIELVGLGCSQLELIDDNVFIPVYGDNTFIKLGGATAINLRTIPNSYTRVDFDVLLDKYLAGNSNLFDIGAEIAPQIVVNLKKPDGTLVYTQTFTNQTPEFCNRFFDEHFHYEYTSGNETYLTLQFIPSYTIVNGTANRQYQHYYVDNLQVETAETTKVAFFYNDRGHRIRKESYSGQNITTTHYVKDISGTTLAVREVTTGPLVKSQPKYEHGVYGNGRIGVFKRNISTKAGGYTLYEITDHLGNVRAVIRKAGSALVSLTAKTDYYPFGMPMPNKHTTDGNYRYAFQGQEKDGETDMEAFELRLWDGRLGRWLTVDPYHEFYSPYVGMGNNPINLIDPDGGMTDGGGDPPSFWQRIGGWFKNTFSGSATENQNVSDDGTYDGGQLNEVVVTPQEKSNTLRKLSELKLVSKAPVYGGYFGQGWDELVTDGLQYFGESAFGEDNFGDGSSENLQMAVNLAIIITSKGKKMPRVSSSLKKILPSWKKVSIDIEHIASGHMRGGSRVSNLKTLFPENMNQEQVYKTVKDAYRNVHTKLKTQGERVLVRGSSNGIEVEMWVNTNTKMVETAYPVN